MTDRCHRELPASDGDVLYRIPWSASFVEYLRHQRRSLLRGLLCFLSRCVAVRLTCHTNCRYAIMVLYVLSALSQWKSSESQALLGLLGLALVVAATLAAFGFTSALGVAFNASSTQVRCGYGLWWASLVVTSCARYYPFWRWGWYVRTRKRVLRAAVALIALPRQACDDLFVVAFAVREVRAVLSPTARRQDVPDQVGWRAGARACSPLSVESPWMVAGGAHHG